MLLASLAGGGGLLFAAAPVSPASDDSAMNSPFLARGDGPALAAAEPPLELRGIMTIGQGTLFSIYEPAKQTTTWVRLNETGPGFVVRGYRAVNGVDQVVVLYRGATYTLWLRKGKTSQAVAKPDSGMRSAGAGVADGQPDTVAGIPMSDLRPEEIGRLQLLISQVRTRIGREKQAAKAAALRPPVASAPSSESVPSKPGEDAGAAGAQ